MVNKKIIYLKCVIIYLIIVFITESLYRNKLYEISVKFEETLKQSGFWNYFFFFWSYIFIYGMMLIATIIVMLYYPYNVFLSYCTIELNLIIIMCFLKSIYANSRPYWDIYNEKMGNSDYSSKPTECDGGFGNPSGHSLMSTSFLNLWYLFINSNFYRTKLWKKSLKYGSLLLVIICIFSVTFSRIYRQIHSINQIMFGTLLGIAIFLTFCYVIEFDKIESNDFFRILDEKKFLLIPLYLIIFGISVILGYLNHNKNENEYIKVLEKFCNFTRQQIFGINTAFHSGVIFIIIGGYIGILFLKYKINKNYFTKEEMFYDWNKRTKLVILKIMAFSFVLPAIPLISVFIIPYKYFEVKFILEVILYFWYGFAAFGLCFYYACVLFIQVNTQSVVMNVAIDNIIN